MGCTPRTTTSSRLGVGSSNPTCDPNLDPNIEPNTDPDPEPGPEPDPELEPNPNPNHSNPNRIKALGRLTQRSVGGEVAVIVLADPIS